jgi:DNA repair exonuclease SbcCD ATPase subunit
MKLELVNFKCHEFKEFEFTENNVILISGKSGVGKTSIIEAIVFVLFGSGRKITKYGQKSCSVRLQITIMNKFLDIKRTKGPNRLTIEVTQQQDIINDAKPTKGNHYEDAAAQEIINELFGHQYESVGYLSQSSINSFVLMGPQEKLTFLENLIFKTSDLKQIKQKIQNLIKERTQLLQTTVGKVEMLTQILDSTDEIDICEFPIRKKSGTLVVCENEQMLMEKNVATESNNAKKRLSAIDKKLTKLSDMMKERENDQNILNQQSRTFENIMTRLTLLEEQFIEQDQICQENNTTKINQYIHIIDKACASTKSQYEENLVKLNNAKHYQQYCTIKKSLNEKRIQYNEIYESEKIKLSKAIEDDKALILSDKDIDQYKDEIKDNNEFISIVKKFREYQCDKDANITKLVNNLEKYGDVMGEKEIKTIADIFDNNSLTIDIKISKLLNIFKQKIQEYQKDIDILTEQLQKIKLEGTRYTCPQCSAKLSLNITTTTLTKVSDTTELLGDIDTIDKKLSKRRKKFKKLQEYENNVNQIYANINTIVSKIQIIEKDYDPDDLKMTNSELDDITSSIEELDDRIVSNTAIVKRYKEQKLKLKDQFLDNSIISGINNDIKKLQFSKDKLYDEYKLLNDDDQDDVDQDDEQKLAELNVSLKYKLEKYQDGKVKFSSLQKDINTYEHEIEKYNSQKDPTNEKKLSIPSIRKHIELNTNEKEKYTQQIQTNIETLHQIEQWKMHHQQYKRYQQQKEELCALESNIADIKKKLQSIFKLKEFVKMAETALLERAINQINQYVANYLDIFFQTDPITIRLYVKEDEKSASRNGQLCLSVDYKGMDADLSILSGGELQRVVIAYNLAMSEIFSVPMILLDECTSNLDQELTEIVVKGIKYNCKGKTMIMIAHQVVSGIFDNVISIT